MPVYCLTPKRKASRTRSRLSSSVRRDDAVGFSLSFLDMLCCGLGAAILLLLVVKHGFASTPIDDAAFIELQESRLQSELDQSMAEKSALSEELQLTTQELDQALKQRAALQETQQDQIAQLRAQVTTLSSARDSLRASSQELKAMQSVQVEVPDPEQAPPGDLGGLNVAESRVLILLDQSASMLAESLVEIIRLRVANPSTQQAAEKWSTARKSAEWAFRQVKPTEAFQLLSFSDTVQGLDGTPVKANSTLQWLNKDDAGASLSDVRQAMAGLHANGPTNLEGAIAAATSLSPSPSQIVLITDGLPTVPGDERLSRIRGCPTPRPNRTPILSPLCRKSIFNRAVQMLRQRLPQTEISIVLLPLEGDAQAMISYWNLAALSGGRVLTPAKGWPW